MQCKNNQTVMFVAGEGRQARNSSRIFHIEIQYSIYFVSKKDVDLKTSTCNNRIVPRKSWQLAEYLIIEYLATFESTETTGYCARETKPDWPLIRHYILHVIQ